MGFYSKYVFPRVAHVACGSRPIELQRSRVVPEAEGRVLEIGIGSGHNLRHYDPDRVTSVVGLDPSPVMRSMAERAVSTVGFDVRLIGERAEEIPLDRGSVDTVVMTWTLCSIDEPERALREMARVLVPGGRLLFAEHGLAPDPGVRRWQRWVGPVWKALGDGCRIGRDIPDLIRRVGFDRIDVRSGYIPGWRPASYNYWGSALV